MHPIVWYILTFYKLLVKLETFGSILVENYYLGSVRFYQIVANVLSLKTVILIVVRLVSEALQAPGTVSGAGS